jgi:aminoglycoside phosphotransferase (APT) family kinase protein
MQDIFELLSRKGTGIQKPESILLPRGLQFTAIVFDSGCPEPRYILKWTSDPDSKRRLDTEFRTLRLLQEKGSESFRTTIPAPLWLEESAGAVFLLEGALPGVRMKDRPPESLFGPDTIGNTLAAVADWLHDFCEAGRAGTGGSAAAKTRAEIFERPVERFLRFFQTTPEERKAVEDALRFIGEAGGGEAIPLARLHGDFSPANILWDDGRIGVIDFELAGDIGPPLEDLFYFLADTQRGEGSGGKRTRRELFEAVYFGTGYLAASARRAVIGFSEKIGLETESLRDLFVLAWVRHAVRKLDLDLERLGLPEEGADPAELWAKIDADPEAFLPVTRSRSGVCENLRQFVSLRDRFVL